MTSGGSLLLILLCALVLRAYGLGEQYYSYDEMMHIQMANAPTLEKAYEYTLFETHPPLMNFIRYFWLKASDDPAYNRLLSLIPGILMVLAMYFLGRKIGDETTGLAAAFITAFAHGTVILSQVVRNYSMLGLVLTMMIYFFLEYKEKRKPPFLILFSILAAAAVSVHLTAVFVIAALVGAQFLAIKENKIKSILPLAISCLPAALLFLFYYITLNAAWPAKYYSHGGNYFANAAFAIPMFLMNIRYFLLPEGAYIDFGENIPFYINMCVGWMLFFAALVLAKKERFLLTTGAIALSLCLVSGLAGEIFIYHSGRRMFFLFPFVALIAARAISSIITTPSHPPQLRCPRAWSIIIISCIPLTLLGIYNKPFLPDEHTISAMNMEKVFEFAEKNLGKDDLLILDKWHAQYFYQWAGKSTYSEISPYKIDEENKVIISPIKNFRIAYNPYFTDSHLNEQMGGVGGSIETLQTLQKKNLITPNTKIWFGAFSGRYKDFQSFAACISLQSEFRTSEEATIFTIPNNGTDLLEQSKSCNLKRL